VEHAPHTHHALERAEEGDLALQAAQRREVLAELAAVRGTREDMAAILSAYERMEQASDTRARMEADIALHTAILKASHNAVIAHFRYAVATYLQAHAKLGEVMVAASEEVWRQDLELHRRIAGSIVTGKPKSAYANTVEMLNEGRSHVRQAREAASRPEQGA